MAALHSHSSSLFMTRDGAPMRFYIRPGPSKRQLAPLITHGGGVVCRIQEPGAFLLADPAEGQLGPGYISTSYITDSVRSNRCLSPRPYRLISLRDLRTRRDQRRSPASKLMSVHEDHTESPTNNVEAPVLKENPTTAVTTTEGETGERRDNMEKTNTAPRKAYEIVKGHGRISTRRSINAKASSEEGMKPVKGTALSTEGTCMEEATAGEKDHNNAGETAAYSTSSGGQTNLPSTKMDVEQTLNEDVNYSMLVIPDPRSSTPALENFNTVRDFEANTAHVSVLLKDGESCLEFMRPKRKVAGRLMLSVGGRQHSPKLKQKKAKEQTDQHSPKQKRAEEQTDQHSPKQKRAEEQTDQHSSKQMGAEEQTDQHSPKQKRAEEQTDQHSPKQKGAEEQTDQHSPKQKGAEEQTDQHSPKQKGAEDHANQHSPKQTRADEQTDKHSPKQTRADEQTDKHSPNPKQNLTEKQTDTYEKTKDETHISVLEEHCGQDVPKTFIGGAHVSDLEGCGNQDQGEDQLTTEESHCAEVQVGQLAKTETGAQALDEQSAESCQMQSGFPPQSHKASAALRRGRMAFTKEEDMAILLYIRDNVSSSRTVTGNALWVEMEKKKVLNRTWQAMKSRYVKYLTYQKHKYKLPPKIPSVATVYVDTPEKGNSMLPVASADILQKNDAMLHGASTDEPQESDTMLPNVSSDCVQNPNPVILGASAESPQTGDAALSSVSSNRAHKCNTLLQIASPDTSEKSEEMPPSDSSDCAQKCTKLHRASSEVPRRSTTLLPFVSSVDPQKRVVMLPIASTNDSQKRDTLLEIASTNDPQKCVTTLPTASTDDPQKRDSLLPIASTNDHQKHVTLLPIVSAVDPQKRSTILPDSSVDNPHSSTTKQHGGFPCADTLVPNIALKEQTPSTPKKRSSNPSEDDESSPRKKGYRMLPPSDDTAQPDQEDSGDSEGLHIFERANMEFEETDDNSSPDLLLSQTKDLNNKDASHVEETPSMSQASESEGLREAMTDMMKEFRIDLFQATQALFFNSGEIGSTRHFLCTGARPDGYPIWEPNDDVDLKKSNPKLLSHLITKYGEDNVAKRAAFLAS